MNGNDSVLLCPRGLAAIPLLFAAALESRLAYLAPLQVTHPSDGVNKRLNIFSQNGFMCLLADTIVDTHSRYSSSFHLYIILLHA